MSTRRALIIAPLYDGKWLPQLAGRSVLVERLSQSLQDYGHYDIEVLDGLVSPGQFRESIYDFFDTDGELLFYFYGHGCLRGSGQGVFATSKARLYDEGVEMSDVTQAALNSKAREVVLILDCCHAGAANPIVKSTLSTIATQINSGVGRCLLAACAEHQQGWETKTKDHEILGAFSSHILEGLAGAASYGQAKVRASFLGAYVTEAFNSWKQDPISQVYETGSRHCVVTSGFPSTRSEGSKLLTIAALKELVARLVKGDVPVNDEPLILGVPFKPSQLFVGRSAEIDYLHTMLVNSDKPVAVSATVEGLGGIGKTELVLQLIHHPDILAVYKTIVWINAAGPIPPQWQKVAHDLGVESPPEEPADLVHQVEQELRQRGNSLIILDNATEWNSVSKLMPRNLALLVTTRKHGFGGNRFSHLELKVLSDEAAQNFLIQMAPELANDPSLLRLIRVLDGHALALELAGWNINYLGLSANEYIERLNKHQADSSHALSATRYGRTIESCLTVTWENLRHPASRVLWRRASLFAPTSAGRELLKASCGTDIDIRDVIMYEIKSLYDINSGKFIIEDEEFSDAYSELRALHVFSRIEGFNGERWAMHRMVRNYGHARLRSSDVVIHSIALSELLKIKDFFIPNEALHFVAASFAIARYTNEKFPIQRRPMYPPQSMIIGRKFQENNFNNSLLFLIRHELQEPKTLNFLIAALTDVNDDVRLQATKLLENVGPMPEVLEGLASSLADPEPQVRRMAGRSLAKHGSEKTISLLNAVVNGPHQQARLSAIQALGLMGKKAVSVLRDALKSDNRAVRIEAALLLCEQGQQDGTQILIEAIQSVSQQKQRRFIDALGAAKEPKAVPTIRRFLSVPFCRSNAIRALGKIAPAPSAVEGLISSLTHTDIDSGMVIRELAKCTDERTISMLGQTVQGPHAGARIGAIRILGLIGEKAHQVLKDALENNDQSVRVEAALLLCEQGQQDGTQILIEAIQSASPASLKEQGRFIDALGIAKDPKAVPSIHRFLSNPRHRIRAIGALGKIGDVSLYALLLDFLGDDNDEVRCAAAKSIEQLKVADGPRAIVTSLAAQLDEKQRHQRHQRHGRFPTLVLEIAERHKIAIPVKVAISFLNSSSGRSGNSEAKQYCAIVLGQAKATEAVLVLIEALGDRNSDVRRETAKALGLIGDPRAKTRLAEVAQKDRNSSVKRAANEALKMFEIQVNLVYKS